MSARHRHSSTKPPTAVRRSLGGTRTLSMLRREAAEWLASILDISVPHSPGVAFRAALANGVLLCNALNKLKPGTITIQARHEAALSLSSSVDPCVYGCGML